MSEEGIIAPFDFFINVLKTAFFWKKMQFEQKREQYLIQRREFLNKGETNNYKATIIKMNRDEELSHSVCLEAILKSLYQKLNISEQIFELSI